MKKPRTPFLLRGCLGAASLLAAQAAHTQSAPPPPAAAAADDSVVLSPFVITSERDVGYVATDSLAGTRLRTPLKDIAASISVVTKQLMDDLGVTNSDQLFVYTTGTEVGGVGGSFSNSTTAQYSQDFENQRRAPDSAVRVRGLAAPDRTRNFWETSIPFDSYNTSSATINRGANAILFGLGSPAGIIETTTVVPSFRNEYKVEAKYGSYGSYRGALDFDQVLIKGKLAARIATVKDARNYEQEPAFRDQERTYAAIDYRPFKGTTLRVNAEKGQIDQRAPRTDPPVDAMSSWWDFGKLERADTYYGTTAVQSFQTLNNLNGAAGNWFEAPSLRYASPDSATPSDGFSSFSTVGSVRYTYLVPRSSKDVALTIAEPVAPFTVSKQITDRSIFDYRKQMIDGPNSRLGRDFNAVNIALEQLFLNGDAGLELVYDRQHATTAWYDRFYTWRGNTIYIDPNRQTVDGRVNENFGRPFISGGGGWSNYVDRHNENARVTGFLQRDFAEKSSGWLGRLLGRHTLTGFYTNTSSSEYLLSGPSAAIATTYYSGRSQNTLETDRPLGTVIYLGPSLANAASPAGAGLQGAKHNLLPTTATVWTNNAQTSRAWQNQTHAVHTFGDWAWLARNTNYTATDVSSMGLVWQGGWAQKLLVSTLGWRRDKVETLNGVQATLDPVTGARPLEIPTLGAPLTADNDLFSYGFALHVPNKWTRRLPGGPRLTLYYNKSENFDVGSVRVTVLGDSVAPQSGKSRDMGFGLSLFDDKLNLRATWYKTNQENMTDARFNATALVRAVDMELRILQSNTVAQLQAAGYQGHNSPGVTDAYKRYLDAYKFNVSATPNADGTTNSTYVRLPNAVETTSSVSEGVEFEMTYNPTRNWRIIANAFEQKATRGEGGAVLRQFLEERLKEWSRPEIIGLSAGSAANTVEAYRLSSFTTYQQAVRSKSQPASELRKWHGSVTSTYSFGKESKLKGWSVGSAARWQDKVAIGYPVVSLPDGTLYEDVYHPFMGGDDIKLDAWLSYRRPLPFLGRKVTWTIQLNVRNLLNESLLVPVRANPIAVGDMKNYEVAAWRIGDERTWELTSRFNF